MSVERRTLPRLETNVQLPCRIPALPTAAVMLDVSLYGCQLDLPQGGHQLGGTVLVDLPGAPRFPGRVVWTHGHSAGIRFERRIPPPAAIALGLEQPAVPTPEREAEPVEPRREGFFRHWIRRLAGQPA